MKRIFVLDSFKRSVKKLPPRDKNTLAKALETFNTFVFTGSSPTGFGFKKINHNKYEFRVGLRLRIIVALENDAYYLVLLGDHNEIRRYLRKFRNG